MHSLEEIACPHSAPMLLIALVLKQARGVEMSHRKPRLVRGRYCAVGVVSAVAPMLTGPAIAQDSTTEPSATRVLEEVTVTARRREERLMDVPVAVTALTEATLVQRNINNLMEVSHFTPGLHFTDQTVSGTSGRSDRASYNIVFRGNSLHSGTVFVDGTPVAKNIPPPHADVARIEVLKGPQAVYFGRSTYTGAINYITRDPGDTFAGRISGEYGSFGSNKVALSLEGPISDQLSARITGSHDFKGGHYKNQTTGGRLGDRQTDSVSLSLVFTPTDKLRIKNWASFTSDEDGVSPSAALRQAAGDFLPNQLNCDLGGVRGMYYCGTLPDWDELPYGTISANDDYTPYMREVFVGNASGFYNASDPDFLDHIGFKRHALSNQFRADYEADSGYGVSFLSGYHWYKSQLLTDMAMVDGRYYDNPRFGVTPEVVLPHPIWLYNQLGEGWDISLEGRLTSPTNSRFRWTLGTNFVRSDNKASTSSIKSTGPGGAQAPSHDQPSTLGIFGGVYFDITPSLTATVEARYQRDNVKTTQIGGSNGLPFPDGPVEFSSDFTHIAPRISLDYRFSDNSMAYVLFSQGFRPGGFNSQLNTASQHVLDQVRAVSGVGRTYDEERLDNYEIGLKSTFLEGRARTTIAAYYNELRKGQTGDQITIMTDEGQATIMFLTANIGAIDLQGIEIEGEFQATQNLKVGATFNFVDSEVKNFFCSDCRSIYGNPDATGNELQQTVKTKYTLYADYTNQFNIDYDWYVRGDYNYRGDYFITTANQAKVPAQQLAGLRVGLESQSVTLEAYVTNLLYDKGLLGSLGLDTVSPTGALPNEIRLSLPDKRAFGLKMSYAF